MLHLSEYAAYSRIEAAKAARTYPVILDLLSDGSVNLTTVGLLIPELTPENHVDLLKAARHKTKRQVQELVAQLRPQPSVPSSIRRLPTPSPVAEDRETGGLAFLLPALSPASALSTTADVPARAEAQAPARRPVVARKPVIAPLAPQRYKVQFTASAATHTKLLQAQELLRAQIPDGDVGEIIDRALTVLLKVLSKRKFAATDRHPPAAAQFPGHVISRLRSSEPCGPATAGSAPSWLPTGADVQSECFLSIITSCLMLWAEKPPSRTSYRPRSTGDDFGLTNHASSTVGSRGR